MIYYYYLPGEHANLSLITIVHLNNDSTTKKKPGFHSVLVEPTALLPTYTLVVYNSFQSIVKSLVYVKETASITLFIGVLFQ